MTEWLTVILLLLFGLGLLIIEVALIPGTTIVGIIGGISIAYGSYMGYSFFGAKIGTYILILILIATLFAFYYSFHSGTWERFALKKTIDSKTNDQERQLVVGEIGVTVSAIRPMGEVDFDGDFREVHSIGADWINSGERVKIVQIEGKKIFVEIYKKV